MIFVDEKLKLELKNIPFFLANEMLKLDLDSEIVSDDHKLSLAALNILKNNINEVFVIDRKIEFDFFSVLLNLVDSPNSILELLASIQVEGVDLEIDDSRLEQFDIEYKNESQKEGGNGRKFILIDFFFENLLNLYFGQKNGRYLVNATAFI